MNTRQLNSSANDWIKFYSIQIYLILFYSIILNSIILNLSSFYWIQDIWVRNVWNKYLTGPAGDGSMQWKINLTCALSLDISAWSACCSRFSKMPATCSKVCLRVSQAHQRETSKVVALQYLEFCSESPPAYSKHIWNDIMWLPIFSLLVFTMLYMGQCHPYV